MFLSNDDAIRNAYDLGADFKREKKNIILFGTGNIAKALYRFFSANHINICCFCDNAFMKKESIHEIPVYSPEEAFARIKNTVVIVTISRESEKKKIFEQLARIGFESVFSWEVFYYEYVRSNTNRFSDELKEDFRKAIRIPPASGEEPVVIPYLSLVITQRCSLRCKYCSYFIPYFDSPVHFEKDDLVKSIRLLAESVDAIGYVVILGGEPFIHPQLNEILNEISKIPNIMIVQVITNCTVVPSHETLQIMADNAIQILGSNYGALSIKKMEIEESCQKNGVDFSISDIDSSWTDATGNDKIDRDDEQKQRLFDTCFARRNCNQLYKGEFHFCHMSAMKTDLEMIPRNQSSYLKIDDEALDAVSRRDLLRKILTDTKTVLACDYCNINRRIPAAEQANQKINYKKYYEN